MRFTRDEHMARMRTYDKLITLSRIAASTAYVAVAPLVIALFIHQQTLMFWIFITLSLVMAAVSLACGSVVSCRLRKLEREAQ